MPERKDIEKVIGVLEKLGCDHAQKKITYYPGFTHFDRYTGDMMQIGGVWVCECGESWDYDPIKANDEDPFDIDFENL